MAEVLEMIIDWWGLSDDRWKVTKFFQTASKKFGVSTTSETADSSADDHGERYK